MPSTVFSCLSWSKSDPRVQEQLDKQRQFGAPRALLRLADLCRERSIPLFIAINPRSRWEQDAKRLGKVRKQPGVKVINMWEDFLRGIRVRNLPDSVLSLPNDPHPSEVKHGVLGEVLTPHFMQFAVAPQP
jgi:hypothetical protein